MPRVRRRELDAPVARAIVRSCLAQSRRRPTSFARGGGSAVPVVGVALVAARLILVNPANTYYPYLATSASQAIERLQRPVHGVPCQRPESPGTADTTPSGLGGLGERTAAVTRFTMVECRSSWTNPRLTSDLRHAVRRRRESHLRHERRRRGSVGASRACPNGSRIRRGSRRRRARRRLCRVVRQVLAPRASHWSRKRFRPISLKCGCLTTRC